MRVALASFAAVLALSGCGRDFPFLATDAEAELRFVPENRDLYAGQAFRFSLALTTGGQTATVDPAEAELSAEPPDLAQIRADGTGVALAAGEGLLVARARGLEATTPVRVRAERLAGIEVAPAALALAAGERGQIAVTGRLEGGARLDLSDGDSGTVYLSSEPGRVAVTRNGEAVALAAGSAAITVRHAEFTETVAVEVTAGPPVFTSIRIEPATVTLNQGEVAAFDVVGVPDQGPAVSILSDRALGLSVTPADLATVDSPGRIRGLNGGAGRLVARLGNREAVATVEVRATMPLDPVLLEVDPGSLELALGDLASVRVTAFFSDGSARDVTRDSGYVSGNPRVARIEPDGRIRAVGVGNAEIEVRFGGISARLNVRVNPGSATVVGLEIRPSSILAEVGNETAVNVLARFSDGTTRPIGQDPGANIRSADEGIARWTGRSVEGVRPGSTLLIAEFSGVATAAPVTVRAGSNPLVRIQLVPPTSLLVGETAPVRVVGVLADGTTVDVTGEADLSLRTLNARLASVVPPTSIRGVAPGTARLRAELRGLTSDATVLVRADSAVELTFAPASLTLNPSEVGAASLFARFASGAEVDVSNDPSVLLSATAPVVVFRGAAGLVIFGLFPGQGTVRAEFQGVQANLPVTIRAPGDPVVRIAVEPDRVTVQQGASASIRVVSFTQIGVRTNISADPSLTFTGGPRVRVRPAPNGTLVVEGLSPGPETVRFRFQGLEAILNVNVTAAPPSPILALIVSLSPTTVQVDTTVNFTVQARRADGTTTSVTNDANLRVTVQPTSLARLDGPGRLRTLGDGSGTVNFELNGVRASVLLTVTPRVVGLTVTPASPLLLTVGETAQLQVIEQLSNMTTRPAPMPTFSLAPAPGPVTVSATGLVTATTAGPGTITVRSSGFSADVQVLVRILTPTLTRLDPAAIAVDAGPTTIAAEGTGFQPGSVVLINGRPVPTNVISPTRVVFTNAGPVFQTPGDVGVEVRNAAGTSNRLVLRIGERPRVQSFSPSSLIAGFSVQLTVLGENLSGVRLSGAPLTFGPITVNPGGTQATTTVSAGASAAAGPVTVTARNDFGVTTFTITVVAPRTGLTLSAGQGINLSGTNSFTSINLGAGSVVTTSGTDPVVLLVSGNVFLGTGSRILLGGSNGVSGQSGGDGGDAGPGGAGGGGGGAGMGAPAPGGIGSPDGDDAAASSGSGTRGGDGGGDGGGTGAGGVCAPGGGGGGRGGRGGSGGAPSGIGSGGAGGSAGSGSAFGGGTGGGGGSTCGAPVGGGGGGGGGTLVIQVATGSQILVAGEIVANGGNGGFGQIGTAVGSGGGGGGSGGRVELIAPTGAVVVGGSGRILARGGTGGLADRGHGGGGGAGGLVKLVGTTVSAPTNRLDVEGGTGGASSRGFRGQNGQPGRIDINP